jgi:hypothetical protein
MIITKKINIPKMNDESKNKMVEFWEKRGVIFTNSSDKELYGKRGSLLGNLFSYNMSKLIATLRIVEQGDNEVICELIINTFMQYVTPWNKEYWALELETFESEMNNNGNLEKKWGELSLLIKKKNFNQVIKFFIGVIMICFLFSLAKTLLS